jgi:hypothetical protein
MLHYELEPVIPGSQSSISDAPAPNSCTAKNDLGFSHSEFIAITFSVNVSVLSLIYVK